MPLELGLALLVFLGAVRAPAESFDQSNSSGLPLDYRTEFSAAAAARSRLGAAVTGISDSFPVASEVWHCLLQDADLAGLQIPFQWRLVLVEDHSVNASSLPDGEVLVDRSLASLLGSNRGLWAALLSHEIAHVAHRHWLRRFLYESQLRQHVQSYWGALAGMDGNGRGQMTALGEQMDAPAASLKFSRELEVEADSEGMMIMARTGFHPDFVLAIHHLLDANVGDEPGFAAILSTHPGWNARDRKNQKVYGVAQQEFVRRWPAVASSPGGTPPTLVFLGGPKADSGHKNPLTVSFSLRCVNPGEPLKSMLRIYQQSGRKGESKSKDVIEYGEPTTCSDRDEKKTLTVALPQNERFEGKWKGEIVILGSGNQALERSQPFAIHSGNVERQAPPGVMAYQDSQTNN